MKQIQIEKVLETNTMKEESKKEAYLNSVKEAAKRKAELEEQKQQELEQKRQAAVMKDQKRIEVFEIVKN